MRYLFTAFILLASVIVTNAQKKFSVGQKVEAYNVDWYKATITEIGSSNYVGYYKVRYDKYNNEQWIKESNIRIAQNETKDYVSGPRVGRYIILSYGNAYSPITLGYFDLGNGTYVYYNAAKKMIGNGKCLYNAKTKTVQWLSGPYKQAGWGGAFEIDRNGKTHKIRINKVTIGSNSTDN